MKKVLLFLIITVSALALFSAGCDRKDEGVEPGSEAVQSSMDTAPDQDLDAAALVNGSKITMSQLKAAVLSVVIQNGMDASHTEAFIDQFGPRILDQLIQGELLYQEAVKNGFEATPEEIDSSFSAISGRYESQEEFQSEMETRGFTETTLRENMATQIAIQKFIGETIVPQAQVPEETVKEAYDQNPSNFQRPAEVKASHILLKIGESDTQENKDEVLSKALEIVSLARKDDADFAQLARERSEGPSAPSGGDLGFFAKGRMVKPFEDAAFSLDVGKVSDPVLTQFGYHIIKVIDRREGLKFSFDEVKEKLAADLKNRMVNEMMSRKISDLKQASQIEIIFKPASTGSQHP